MSTFITLVTFTDQGARNAKDSPDRLEAFKALAKKMGTTVKGAYYTMGAYDIVTIVEGADESVAALLMKTSSLGNVRTQTMRAFSPEEVKGIIQKMSTADMATR